MTIEELVDGIKAIDARGPRKGYLIRADLQFYQVDMLFLEYINT